MQSLFIALFHFFGLYFLIISYMMIWKKYKNKANKKINYKLKNKRVTENLINILKEEN